MKTATIVRLLVGTGLSSVVLAASAGTGLRARTVTEAFPGREIVFTSTPVRGGGVPHLYLMRPDGTEQRRITMRLTPEGGGKWSPDGKWIAFSTRFRRNDGIYVMRPDGTALRRVIDDHSLNGGLSWSRSPSWGLNGKTLAFTSQRPPGTAAPLVLWVINVNGTGLRRLADNVREPAWSPDGQTIAFERTRPGSLTDEIWLINADGTNERRLTATSRGLDPNAYEFQPDWSPDSDAIAFVRGYRQRSDIYVIRPDGSDHRRLTHGPGFHFSPTWSPNGRRIAFESGQIGSSHIYVMNADGTRRERLTTARPYNNSPDW